MPDRELGRGSRKARWPSARSVVEKHDLGLVHALVETDYENCRNDINDVYFLCSLPYVTFERQGISPPTPIAAPVLEGDRYGGKPIYFSASRS